MDHDQATDIIRNAAARMWRDGNMDTDMSAAAAICRDPAMAKAVAAIGKARFHRWLTVEQFVRATWREMAAHCTCPVQSLKPLINAVLDGPLPDDDKGLLIRALVDSLIGNRLGANKQ